MKSKQQSVFEKFGGIRPMALILEIAPSTVKSWHRKKVIPPWRHAAILDAAAKHGIKIGLCELQKIRAEREPFRRGPKASKGKKKCE